MEIVYNLQWKGFRFRVICESISIIASGNTKWMNISAQFRFHSIFFCILVHSHFTIVCWTSCHCHKKNLPKVMKQLKLFVGWHVIFAMPRDYRSNNKCFLLRQVEKNYCKSWPTNLNKIEIKRAYLTCNKLLITCSPFCTSCFSPFRPFSGPFLFEMRENNLYANQKYFISSNKHTNAWKEQWLRVWRDHQ